MANLSKIIKLEECENLTVLSELILDLEKFIPLVNYYEKSNDIKDIVKIQEYFRKRYGKKIEKFKDLSEFSRLNKDTRLKIIHAYYYLQNKPRIKSQFYFSVDN